MTIKLPSGATVELMDVKDIKHRDRKKLYSGVDDSAPKAEQGFLIMDNLLTIAVKEWSFDLLPPNVKRESLDELSVTDYEALTEAAKPIMDALFPSSKEASDPKVGETN